MTQGAIPNLDLDIFADASLLDPYSDYAAIRDAAPIVRLPRYDLYVMGRHEDVTAALKAPDVFTSGQGVGLNDVGNAVLKQSLLGSDDPLHARLRLLVQEPLSPARVNALREIVFAEAERLVDSLMQAGRFDAAIRLAPHLPAKIVFELLGVPDIEVDELLESTKGGFNSLGPIDAPLTRQGIALSQAMKGYAMGCTPDRVRPGSWADALFGHARAGTIPFEQAAALIFDYLGPSLDTTITATTSFIKLFAENPEQWQRLRERPTLIPNAINEVLRLESPIRGFSRRIARDVTWRGNALPEGGRVLLLYGSANRDERRWSDPARFDIERDARDHLGFGHGVHACVGANLARLEMTALLTALTRRVERFELIDSHLLLNNFLRGQERLVVELH